MAAIPTSFRFPSLQLVLLKQNADRIRRVLPFAAIGEQRSRLEAMLVVVLAEIAQLETAVVN